MLVIHENRGLNPYIEDVARRAATEGFLALAPDGLFPVGGYPGNDDDGRTLQAELDQAKLRTDMVNSARYPEDPCALDRQARRHRLLLGRRHDQLPGRHAGRRHEGRRAVLRRRRRETASVPKIKAPLLVQYAENDERINAMWPAYEAALKAAGVPYEMYIYPGTQHGFHNNSTPRYTSPRSPKSAQIFLKLRERSQFFEMTSDAAERPARTGGNQARYAAATCRLPLGALPLVQDLARRGSSSDPLPIRGPAPWR